MNANHEWWRRGINLFLICACCCLLGCTVYGVAGEVNSVAVLDLNRVKDKADLVLVGTLESVPPPFEVLGRDFYRIKPQKVLKGELVANSLLSVVTNTDSSLGKPPAVESKITYMLLLQKTKLQEKEAPAELVTYCLVGNWKGIISLDKSASENRAVRNMEKWHGINVQDRVADFREAIRYCLETRAERDEPRSELSKSAREVYEALKLIKK